MRMPEPEIQDIELDLLLEAIFKRYGYDFRSYARSSISRRTLQFMANMNMSKISELISPLMRNPDLFSKLAYYYSIAVTDMFRDPEVYGAIRKKVVPMLKTWPHVKVWHAGCATGEEVYSMAILLKEERLYDRATIYATDFNDESLSSAREGVFEVEKIREATKNYQKSGGLGYFTDYYHANYGVAKIDESLKSRITFANHNLSTDSSFGEMEFILCRNVMIYFNRELQNKVLKIFTDSLVYGGFLCLGVKEDLRFSDVVDLYEVVDEKLRIYRKKL